VAVTKQERLKTIDEALQMDTIDPNANIGDILITSYTNID
jgi:hypothetical protein